jgi:signal peptidase I
MTDSGKPSPGKAFLLGLLAPGLGHRYAGRRKRGQIALIVTLALMGLAIALVMLPPINLPVLILIAFPLLALVVWWFASAIGAAIEATRAEPAAQPLGLRSPILSAAEIVVNLVSICGLAFLLYSLSSIGSITTPNDDMAPTTLGGDFVVTWKDYYRDRLPERGDVAVVQLPGVKGKRIMRIIGLPGDNVLGVLGVLTINGEAVERDGDGDFSWRDAAGTHRNAPRHIETLPGGAHYRILQSAEGMFTGTLFGASLRIPDGHYFVIGDNRDSTRSSWDFGMLPGLVLGDRPTVILSSSLSSLIGRSVQP